MRVLPFPRSLVRQRLQLSHCLAFISVAWIAIDRDSLPDPESEHTAEVPGFQVAQAPSEGCSIPTDSILSGSSIAASALAALPTGHVLLAVYHRWISIDAPIEHLPVRGGDSVCALFFAGPGDAVCFMSMPSL